MNPIKGSDLYSDDGALKRLVDDLKAAKAAGEDALSGIRKDAKDLEKQLQSLTGQTVDQRDVITELAKRSDKLAQSYTRYQASLSDTEVQLAAVRNAQNQVNRLNKLEAKQLAAKADSYDALSAELSVLKIRYKQLTQAEIESTKAGQQLVGRINQITTQLKKADKRIGVSSRNVGNYKDSIKGAVNEMGELPGAAGAAGRGVQGLGQTLKALLANPVVLFLAAITAALAAIFRAFKQSKDGAELFSKATAALNGILTTITSVLSDVGRVAVEAFENPQETLLALGEFLKDQVINRFLAIINLGGAIGKLFKGEFKQAAEEAAIALTQLATGFDAEDQEAIGGYIADTTEKLKENTQAYEDLAKARRAFAKNNLNVVRSIEQLTTAEAKAQAVADDTTKSFAEREEAAEQARAALEKRAKLEIRLARNRLGFIRQEIAIRERNGLAVTDLLDGQIAAYRELATAERELTTATANNERERAELKQDRLERDLDILIDGFDNQKTINERIVKDDKRTFAERRKVLQETARLADESFAKQIETIQQFTGVQVDANELLNASSAVTLNERIRALGLSEIIEGRLLEIVRERRTAVLDLTEAERDLGNAQAEALKQSTLERIEANEKLRETELKLFDDRQALKRSEFNLEQRTEEEKTRFRIQAEIDRLEKVLALNEKYSGELSETVLQTYRNQVKTLQNELEQIDAGQSLNLFDSLGFSFTDKQQSQLISAFDFAKSQLLDYLRVQKELTDQAVQAADRRVQAAQSALQAEISANEQGLASNIETRRRELEDAEEQQRKALEQQRKAARAERRIQTVQQATNLVSASAKVFAQFGFPAALPIVALMFGAFAAAKLKAGQLVKQQQFGKGGHGAFAGSGSHATGDHIAFGQQGSTQLVAEPGERWAVLNKRSSRKYGRTFGEVVDLFNAGKFETAYQPTAIERAISGIPFAPELRVTTNRTDLGPTNNILTQIAGHVSEREYIDGDGKRIVKRGPITTRYT